MSAIEASPSRGHGITHILSKGRSRSSKASTSASNSIISTESDQHHGMRASIESAIEKLKNHERPELPEDENDEGSNKLEKLLPKSIKTKQRKKRREKEDEERASEEAARGRSIAERGTLENDSSNNNYSNNSLLASNSTPDGDGSSLITYDSDEESSNFATPPPLSSRPSHTGYLTTSSPLIQTSVHPEALSALGDATSRSSTFPALASELATSQSPAPSENGSLRAPDQGASRRSSSPVGRLAAAFKPRKSPSPNTSPERNEQDSKKDKNTAPRRGSVAARIGGLFPEKGSQTSQSDSVSRISTSDRPRTAKAPPLINTTTPQTPPRQDEAAPVIVNTPPTPTDSSAPRFASPHQRTVSEPPVSPPDSGIVTSPSGNMISHRRVRSGSANLGPSKLSNIVSAPLTPTLELSENGGTTPNAHNQSSFFSSVFSAAQNAASTLTNTISNSNTQNQTRNKSDTQDTRPDANVEVESPVQVTGDAGEIKGEKELAVKTLGMGDLSLSHLGISEAQSASTTPVASKFPDLQDHRGRSESAGGDSLAGRAITSSHGLMADNPDNGPSTHLDDVVRPRSAYEPSVRGDQTPPNGSVFEGKSGIHRSGSVRSAIENRRKRGSSAATGNTVGAGTIGAAIAAANASVAHPQAAGSTPKLTGFAVASKKRNRDFHQLFRSVPDDDYLIEDYSCALQREILAHGRLYVSEGHLCFSSNIFGWVTTLVMSFDEIVSVEKRSTALLFKNGLMISTLHSKNVFASFTSRDSTYDLIVGIWKLGHPSLRSSLNGVRIDETGGGDKTEKDDGTSASASEEGSSDESEDGDDIYDEDDEDEDGMSFTNAGDGSVDGSDAGEKTVSRKPSAAVVTGGAPEQKSKEGASAASSGVGAFPGPATHAPTDCTDGDTHYDKVIGDEVIAAPLGKIYDIMFGPGSVQFMSKWLTNEQKCLDLQMEDKKGLSNDNKVRVCSYIKPLNGSIGPKQTKCVITETLDFFDLEKAVSVTVSTQTPDVPSGNVFSTKTKYCLTWAEGNATRILMSCAIEWTGKSWLKGPIEKGANDGQVQYAKEIAAALRSAVSARPRTNTTATVNGKGKKKGRKDKGSKTPKSISAAASKKPVASDWGILEPLHGPLGPVVDIFEPLLSTNVVIGIIAFMLLFSWLRSGGIRGGGKQDLGFYGTPERIAAYEEIWRREESELWEWLEERVGLERLHSARGPTSRTSHDKAIEDRLKSEGAGEKEIANAIKITEERLMALKAVVEKKKQPAKSEVTDVD